MRNLWIVAAVWLFSGAAGAFQTINNGTTFPAVVQGHGGTSNGWCGWWGNNYSTLTMNGSAKITGTEGRTLNFCYSNQNAGMPVDSCDNSNGSRRLCTITPDTIQGLSTSGGNAFLAGNGSSGGVPFCSAGQAISLGSASQYQFSSLSLYSSCTVTFSSARTEYRIQKIEAGNGAKLILPSGDY
ncbi:MSHA biogenesis protein MshQ, partial [Aeromonas sp. HMWF017]